jgi:uncharacterized protein YndB with AHSA1/START domain
MTPSGTTTAPRTVSREITLDAPAEAVWRALTVAGELTRWFPEYARVRPGPDGSIWMKWEGMYEAESPVEAWEPERHLRIGFPIHGTVRLATDYHLESDGGRTVLRVVTSGFGEGTDWKEWFDGVSTGWDFELRSLQHYLERHRGQERITLSLRARYDVSQEEAWKRLTGPSGWLRFAQPPVEGTSYHAQVHSGRALGGTVIQSLAPRQLVLTVDQINDGIMRLELERGNAVVLWLAAWGIQQEAVRQLEAEWRDSFTNAVGSPDRRIVG